MNGIIETVRARGGWRLWLLYPPGPVPRVASWLRGRGAMLRNPHASITIGDGVYLGPGFSVDAPDGGELVIGDSVELRRGFRTELDGPAARVEIGPRSICANGVLIQCASEVTIGADCQIDHVVLLVDGNHQLRRLGARAPLPAEIKPLQIGDHVTITSKCTITASVGHHSLIGANSVVLQELPPHSLAAGSPAQLVGRFGPSNGIRR